MKERKELIAIVAGVIVVATVWGIFLTMFLISS